MQWELISFSELSRMERILGIKHISLVQERELTFQRFDEIKKSPPKFFGAFMVQGTFPSFPLYAFISHKNQQPGSPCV